MAKSLADQLLSAGLVDKKKVKQAQHEKRKQAKQGRKGNSGQENDVQARLQREREEKAARDRELNQQRQQAEAARALQAQVEQMVSQGRLSVKGEVRFNFTDKRINKIKQLYVSDDIHKQLARGQLGICSLNDGYAVVPKDVALKVKERDEASLVFLAEPKADQPDEDDPYKDFQIPDDLMW